MKRRWLQMFSVRHLPRMLLAVAAGAGITLATAWGIAWNHSGPPKRPLRYVSNSAMEWPHWRPLGWPESPDSVSITRATGWTYSVWMSNKPIPPGPYAMGGWNLHEQKRTDFGVPFRALGYWEAYGSSAIPHAVGSGPVPQRFNPKPILTEFARCKLLGATLPLSPIWPGLALNTLVYAACVWAISHVPRVVRRWRRKKTGLCGKCGYDLTGIAEGTACPECGSRRGSGQ